MTKVSTSFKKGHIPIFAGKTKENDMTCLKISQSMTLERLQLEMRCLKCHRVFFVIRKIDKSGQVRINSKERRYCSRKCANSHVHTEEQNTKISLALTKERPVCLQCEKRCKGLKQKYCSRVCQYSSRLFHENLSRGIRKAVSEGRNIGWQSRKKMQPSYAEKYFIKLFQNEKISDYEREKHLGKYFIDFAFSKKMIALEIDGKQHARLLSRIESDKKKDIFLRQNGWKVIRLKWFDPKSEENKKKLYPQIKSLKTALLA